jgi:hypothetical protein
VNRIKSEPYEKWPYKNDRIRSDRIKRGHIKSDRIKTDRIKRITDPQESIKHFLRSYIHWFTQKKSVVIKLFNPTDAASARQCTLRRGL